MLFDPVLNSACSEEESILYEPGSMNKPLICSHCYRPIKGKYFQSGENFYDEYCWQFKFVIDPLYIRRSLGKKIKKDDEEDYDH